jgi:hypothetical protein
MLKITTADQRLQARSKTNMVIFGPSGAGKTFLLRTLPESGKATLAIDLEAGLLAVNEPIQVGDAIIPPFAGASLDVRREAETMGVHPWELSRALACVLCGPDPAAAPGSPYSREAHAHYVSRIGDATAFAAFDTVFVDSITVAARHAFSWAQRQPQAFGSNGKPDIRGAYGLLGQEMVSWLTQLQHIPDKNVIVVGILDAIEDKDFPGKVDYAPQIDGSKAGRELPGIFDQVMTLGLFSRDDAGNLVLDMKRGTTRGMVCRADNGFGVPAKDRSGRLSPIEPPNLAAVFTKISSR